MGLVKWFKNTFLGGDSKKKKKKLNSDGSVNVASSTNKGESSKTYQAYKKSASKKSESTQKQVENAWGNVFSKGTLWNDSSKKSDIKSLNSDKDSSKSDSTGNKAKYKSLVSNAENNKLASNVAEEKLKASLKTNKKSDSKNGESSKERTESIKKTLSQESLSKDSTPTALRGTGKGTLQKKLESKIKEAKESQAKYEKSMGDDKKSKHEVQLEQKIGSPERTKKDLKYASEETPKALYTARKLANGITLGGEKLLEKLTDKDTQKTLKKNDKSADETRIKPVESKKLSNTDERLLAESPKGLSGKKAKGVSGKTVGEVAEIAGNMATFGATSGITKGIGEKGLNKLAKATKLGETAEEALEKSKLVKSLSNGNKDVAKKVANRLADGLAEGVGVDSTAGAIQSATDASIKKSEDKDTSWTKEFAKNQAVNFALGGATELGLSALKSKKLKSEAAKQVKSTVDDFVNSRTAKEKASNLSDNAKKDISELLNSTVNGKKKAGNDYSAYKLDPDTKKSLATTPEKRVYKRNLQGESVPMSAIEDGTVDDFRAYESTNKNEKLDNQKKLKSINGKISRTQKQFDKLDMEGGLKQDLGLPWTDAEETKLSNLEHKLENQKTLRNQLAKQKESIASRPKSYDGWKALNESKATAENTIKASDNVETKSTKLLSEEDRINVENEIASLDEQKKQIETEQINKIKSGENNVSDMAKREAQLQEIESRQKELKQSVSEYDEGAKAKNTENLEPQTDENTQKLKVLDSKIAELEEQVREKEMENATELSDEEAFEFNRINYELDAYKEQRKRLAKQISENNNVQKQVASSTSESNDVSSLTDSDNPQLLKGYADTVNHNKKIAGAKEQAENTYLEQRGDVDSRADTMLNEAEQTVTPSDVKNTTESTQTQAKSLIDSVDTNKLNKDSHLDRAILNIKKDYNRAIRRGDTESAERLANEFTKTYNAKRVVESTGEDLLNLSENLSSERTKVDFHIPNAEEMRGLGNDSKIVPTTVKQSNEFAENVDLANVEHALSEDGMKTGRTTKTMYNAAKSDEAREMLSNMTENGFLDTVKRSVKADTKQVINDVVANPTSIAQELQNYIDGSKGFYLDDSYKAMLKAEALYSYCSKHAVEDEGFQKGLAVASNYIAKYGSTTGNTLRAISMFSSCSPKRQRLLVESNLKEMCKEREFDVAKLLGTEETPSELAKKIEALENADSDFERNQLRKSILNEADKITSDGSILDTLNTWRYLAMLSKPTTHVRNATGNAVSTSMRFASDGITMAIQDYMYKNGLIDEKTVGKLSFDDMLTILGKSNKTDAKYEALNKYLDTDVALLIGNTEKYGSTKNEWYKNTGKVTRTIKRLSDFNSGLMNKADEKAVATNYKKRFLQYLNANGFSENAESLEKATKQSDELVNSIKDYRNRIKKLESNGNESEAKTLRKEMAKIQNKVASIDEDIRKYELKQQKLEDKARVHAQEEALESTFREQNELADLFKNASKKGRKQDATVVQKAVGFMADATNPFAGTSSNILRQSVRFSPVGLAINTKNLSKAIKSGDVQAINTAVEKVAGGLTGTGVFALGVYLAQNEIGDTSWNPLSWSLQDSMSDSDTDYYQKSLGVQDYSIVVGSGDNRYSLTLDWLTPTVSALFMGGAFGEIAKTIGDKTAYEGNYFDNTNSAVKVLSNVIQPVLETSMLDTFSDILTASTSDSETNPVINITKSMTQSYISSFAPNLLRGVAKTLRPYEYSHATESTSDGGKQSEKWFNNLKNGFRIDDGGDAKTDVWGNVSGKRGNILVSAFNGLANPANVKKVTLDKTDQENIKLYNQLNKADNSNAKYALPQTYYKTTANINGTSIKLDSVDVSKLNQARATKEGAKEAINDLLDLKAFNKKSVRLSDNEKEKLLNKNFKNTKEVVSWLHTTKAWKKASASEKATMQMTVLGQTQGEKKKGSAKAGFVDVYEHQGKSAVDFYYDNDITQKKKEKLKDLAKTKAGKQAILDFADGAVSKSFSDDGQRYDNYPLKTMYPYLNEQVSKGNLTEKQASQLFEAYKSAQTKRTYYYGASAGSSGYSSRRYGSYRRYRHSGGSSSSSSGAVSSIKTSAFSPTTTSSDYKSFSSSSSSTSSKKKYAIKSNVSSTAPTVKSAESFVKVSSSKKKKS